MWKLLTFLGYTWVSYKLHSVFEDAEKYAKEISYEMDRLDIKTYPEYQWWKFSAWMDYKKKKDPSFDLVTYPNTSETIQEQLQFFKDLDTIPEKYFTLSEWNDRLFLKCATEADEIVEKMPGISDEEDEKIHDQKYEECEKYWNNNLPDFQKRFTLSS